MSVKLHGFITAFENSKKLEARFNPVLELQQGELIAIIGGNGVGKTTMLEVLAGLRKTYQFNGEVMGCKNPSKLKKKKRLQIGFLPSNPSLFFSKPTIKEEFEHVEELSNSKNWIRWEKKWKQRANFSPFALSWGEQRLLILDLLFSQGTQIYLLDDFIVSIDHVEAMHVAKQIGELINSGKIVITVSRDPKVLYYLPEKTIIYKASSELVNSNKKTVFEKCSDKNPFSLTRIENMKTTSNSQENKKMAGTV